MIEFDLSIVEKGQVVKIMVWCCAWIFTAFLPYFEDEEEKEERLEEGGGVHLQNLLWIMGKIPKLHPSNPRKISPGTIHNMPSYSFHSFP